MQIKMYLNLRLVKISWAASDKVILIVTCTVFNTESQKLKHELFDNQFAQIVIPENTLFVLIREKGL